MRAIALAILASSLSQAAALAADFDPGPLRGTQYAPPAVAPVTLWEGPYFGGFGGVSQSDFGFKGAFKSLLAGLSNIRNTAVEDEYTISNYLTAPITKNGRDAAFGAFAGYNTQFEDVVLGFEVDYTHTGLTGTAADEIGRLVTTGDGYVNDVFLSGTASTKLEDYGTLRVRAGYAAGAFLPFVTAGVALGQLKTSTSVTARIAGYDSTAYNAWLADPANVPAASINTYGYSSFDPRRLSARQVGAGVSATASKSTVAVGFTAGVGVDFALMQNIFLRAEYQYAWFDDFDGHKLNVNTIRGGAGVKF